MHYINLLTYLITIWQPVPAMIMTRKPAITNRSHVHWCTRNERHSSNHESTIFSLSCGCKDRHDMKTVKFNIQLSL